MVLKNAPSHCAVFRTADAELPWFALTTSVTDVKHNPASAMATIPYNTKRIMKFELLNMGMVPIRTANRIMVIARGFFLEPHLSAIMPPTIPTGMPIRLATLVSVPASVALMPPTSVRYVGR